MDQRLVALKNQIAKLMDHTDKVIGLFKEISERLERIEEMNVRMIELLDQEAVELAKTAGVLPDAERCGPPETWPGEP